MYGYESRKENVLVSFPTRIPPFLCDRNLPVMFIAIPQPNPPIPLHLLSSPKQQDIAALIHEELGGADPRAFRSVLPLELFDNTDYETRLPEHWVPSVEGGLPAPAHLMRESSDGYVQCLRYFLHFTFERGGYIFFFFCLGAWTLRLSTRIAF